MGKTNNRNASFQKEFLETHNAYRRKHNTPQMTLSSEMTASAQKWSEHLCSLYAHSIYICSLSYILGKEAVDSWYGEIKDYNWSSPGYSSATGHFTQVVWKDSTELGVGLATDGRKVFVVGQYRAAGNMNMAGYFEENVLPEPSDNLHTPVSDHDPPCSPHHTVAKCSML
uniref:Im:7150988 n=1 Tax=Cyclopterus lumpus TaxID=8103 RepID=A0A8C3A9C0_CYCLU